MSGSEYRRRAAAIAVMATLFAVPQAVASGAITPARQAVAEAAAGDDAVAAFYRGRGFAPIWTGAGDTARRRALVMGLETAGSHGLPVGRFDPGEILRRMGAAQSTDEVARLEIDLTRVFLDFARAMHGGVLDPAATVPQIKRARPAPDERALLGALAGGRPAAVMRGLAPRSAEYARLFAAKAALGRVVAEGGWGPAIPEMRIDPGDRGAPVVALRDRLHAMGYLARGAGMVYDRAMRAAVERFQRDHGLDPDGIVGGATLRELNTGPLERLGAVVVAMERERWTNAEPDRRHIRVNLTDFTARIMVDGDVRFETRTVIGKHEAGRETPEFSDTMEHMTVNPSWYVPRSIVVEEYLPGLRRNPQAFGHMEITDAAGRPADRRRGFARYDAGTFPFRLRQPPGPGNALGQVKFMFPNRYNIYLHDTPATSLFDRPVRAFSHGCVRVGDPSGFAHTLLSFQTDDPDGTFRHAIESERETTIRLAEPLPVHIVYRTAVSNPAGGMTYRADVYGRDARILAALRAAGVAMPGGAS